MFIIPSNKLLLVYTKACIYVKVTQTISFAAKKKKKLR